jgi:hypothetical protein
MRVIKLFLIVLIGTVSCKKDRDNEKVSPSYILQEGYYVLGTSDDDGGGGYFYYYVKENNIYVVSQSNSQLICWEKPAGVIYKNGDSIQMSALHMQNYSGNSICFFSDEHYGGDTMIFHFSNIVNYTHPRQTDLKGLSGNFYYNIPFGHPFSKNQGTFNFLRPRQ